ncbi:MULTISPECIES: hypothetical protein [Halomonadaceae]|uniref:hypothetical protein n=1 Tax=Halomonadaceae TaxID=28256 RepID=UPI0011BEF20E|nr:MULTISPECIES: hypothetical protein [Halomonas]
MIKMPPVDPSAVGGHSRQGADDTAIDALDYINLLGAAMHMIAMSLSVCADGGLGRAMADPGAGGKSIDDT